MAVITGKPCPADLPREIRDIIFEYLFDIRRIVLTLQKVTIKPTPHLSILRTCRLLHREGSPAFNAAVIAFLSQNALTIRDRWGLGTMITQFVMTYGKHITGLQADDLAVISLGVASLMENIKHIHIKVPSRQMALEIGSFDKEKWKTAVCLDREWPNTNVTLLQ